MSGAAYNGNGSQPELDHIQVWSWDSLKVAPENDNIYKAIAWDDPELGELARSIKERGIQDPILVSWDGYIISGHRRRMAARIAELELVPVRVHPLSRTEDPDGFLKLLVEMNSQRIKSASELLHESIIKVDPKAAHKQIVHERLQKERDRNRHNRKNLSVVYPFGYRGRCELSSAKTPLLNGILRVLEQNRDYWPISARQVFYKLLGPNAPLLHASKPSSRFSNDNKKVAVSSYRALIDVLTRGRIKGLIPWESTEDETRPVDLNAAFDNPAQFFRQEFRNFLTGYWRNRQQSQPDHIEICLEKLTMRTFVNNIAREYTIPVSTLRGMGTTLPKHDVATRFGLSRKKKLLLLIITDLDPAGDAIAENLVNDFRHDYGINNIEAFKIALTMEQVEEFHLPVSMLAKEKSPTYQKYVQRYGTTNAYELDAMDPEAASSLLHSGIQAVMDTDLYNQEIAAEEADSAQIIAVREQAEQFFRSLNLGQ